MKDRTDAILRESQARYLDHLLPPRDPLLQEMEELAGDEHPRLDALVLPLGDGVGVGTKLPSTGR